ncbi:MAG: tRNA dihydrouridine synthase DusB [Bacillota bacterium]|nr:tRNA dihydrouridine synthase DusB [Bacillota bacterium]
MSADPAEVGFSIGPVRIHGRIVLAPMAGITDIVFRAICIEHGASLVYTEMVSANGLIYSNRQSQGIIEISPAEHPIGAQIFGREPEAMSQAALLVAKAGPDFIDINMGCPVPKVVKNREGCALMLEPERAQEVIRAVRTTSRLPVTVKMRKGWDVAHQNAVEFALACEEAGVSAIAVHGRTRTQMYSGKADWDIIARVKESVCVPVIGNGDIWQPADAQNMLRETGCDAVMVARGALGCPWIFANAKRLLAGGACEEPGFEDRIEMALRHLRLAVVRYGERTGVPLMRKHLSWYMKGLVGSARVKAQVNVARSAAAVESILGAYLERARQHNQCQIERCRDKGCPS